MEKINIYSYSFIIPCFNEEKDIYNTIDACLKQDYEGEYDIICVDDGSKDRTVEIILKIAKENSRIKLVELKCNKGVSNARNVGSNMSKNDILIFLNADEIPQKNFLKSINKKYVKGADYFFPQTKVNNTDTIYGKYREAYRKSKYAKPNTLLWSQGFSCRREVFTRIQGFNTEYPGCGGEDWDLVLRLEQLGLNRCVDFNIVVYHNVPQGIRNVIWHMYNRGRGTAYCDLLYQGVDKGDVISNKIMPILITLILFFLSKPFSLGIVSCWFIRNQQQCSRIWKESNNVSYVGVLILYYMEICLRYLGYIITVLKYKKRL